jgi:putative ABC transport system permease protein
MLAITLRDLAHRRRQFVVAVVVTGLLFALALDLTGMSQGFRTETKAIVASVGADAWFVQPGVSGPFTSVSVLPAGAAETLGREPGVQRADPLVIVPATIDTANGVRGINLIGHVPGGIGTPAVSSGRAARSSGDIVVNGSLGFHLGDRVMVGGHSFEVVGTVRSTYFAGTPVVLMTLSDAQAIAFGGQPVATTLVSRGQPRELPDGLRLLTNDDVRRDLLRPTANPTTTIDNTRLFMWAVAGLIVGAVTYLAVLERLRDFAVLKAVGTRGRSLVASVCLQAVLTSLLAAALAVALANLLRPAFQIPVDITLNAYLTLPVVAVLVGMLASIVALRRVSRVDPALAFAG